MGRIQMERAGPALTPHGGFAPHAVPSADQAAGLSGGVGIDKGVFITGDSQDNAIFGSDLREEIRGLGGDDFLVGFTGKDTLIGGVGNDELVGLEGNDILQGNGGDDILRPGVGNDVISGGGGGFDWVYYHNPSVDGTDLPDDPAVTVDLAVTGPQDTGRGRETITGIEVVVGTNGSDHISGADRSEILSGWDGNDFVDGRGGDDFIVIGHSSTDSTVAGGDGIDTLDVSYLGGVTIDLNVTTAQQGVRGQLTVSGIENVSGSDYKDLIVGTAGDNIVFGSSGDDTLEGGAGADKLYADGTWDAVTGQHTWGNFGLDSVIGGDGDDTIEGGGWSDQLYGGAGSDTFMYVLKDDSQNDRLDTIHDLENADVIDMSHIEVNYEITLTLVAKLTGTGGGEVAMKYDKATDTTDLMVDINGDGHAEMHIDISGNHTDFTNFVF